MQGRGGKQAKATATEQFDCLLGIFPLAHLIVKFNSYKSKNKYLCVFCFFFTLHYNFSTPTFPKYMYMYVGFFVSYQLLLLLGLPLANMLEKSVSVRLKRGSPLSQASRFLAAPSLKERMILPLSSKLLFFCRNPTCSHGQAQSAEWLHLPYMTRTFFGFVCFAI